MHTEPELINRILQGDLYAFKLLVKQHEKLVRHMATRLMSNEADVEDVCQEVFIKVYRHLGNFKFQSKLSTWIASIAYSTTINQLRKESGKKNVTDDIGEYEYQHSTTDTPESLLHKKDTAAFVQQEIARLPVNYRTVLTLYHLNEFSYQEIEEITGLPEGTVKSYLFRARKLLKDRLQRYIHA
jgi:RNA polymerase sigma factor (sigma-70 family)